MNFFCDSNSPIVLCLDEQHFVSNGVCPKIYHLRANIDIDILFDIVIFAILWLKQQWVPLDTMVSSMSKISDEITNRCFIPRGLIKNINESHNTWWHQLKHLLAYQKT